MSISKEVLQRLMKDEQGYVDDNLAMRLGAKIKKMYSAASSEVSDISMNSYRILFLYDLVQDALQVWADYTYILSQQMHEIYTNVNPRIETLMNDTLLRTSMRVCSNLNSNMIEIIHMQKFYETLDPELEYQFNDRQANIYAALNKVVRTTIDAVFHVNNRGVRTLLYKYAYQNIRRFHINKKAKIKEIFELDSQFSKAFEKLGEYKRKPIVRSGNIVYRGSTQFNIMAYINDITRTMDPRVLHFVVHRMEEWNDPRYKNDIALLKKYTDKLPL